MPPPLSAQNPTLDRAAPDVDIDDGLTKIACLTLPEASSVAHTHPTP